MTRFSGDLDLDLPVDLDVPTPKSKRRFQMGVCHVCATQGAPPEEVLDDTPDGFIGLVVTFPVRDEEKRHKFRGKLSQTVTEVNEVHGATLVGAGKFGQGGWDREKAHESDYLAGKRGRSQRS